MPTHHIQEPSPTRRHTYQFTYAEILHALKTALEQPVPQGECHIWGLEHHHPQRRVTLVIDEDVSARSSDGDRT